MNVFYEESGSFKVGSIVSRNDASLQVDTQHGKRAKHHAGARRPQDELRDQRKSDDRQGLGAT